MDWYSLIGLVGVVLSSFIITICIYMILALLVIQFFSYNMRRVKAQLIHVAVEDNLLTRISNELVAQYSPSANDRRFFMIEYEYEYNGKIYRSQNISQLYWIWPICYLPRYLTVPSDVEKALTAAISTDTLISIYIHKKWSNLCFINRDEDFNKLMISFVFIALIFELINYAIMEA